MTTTGTTAPSLPKANLACLSCRRRKLRCDAQAPSCGNCLLYSETCAYPDKRKKSGPPKGYKRKPKLSPPAPDVGAISSSSTPAATSPSVPPTNIHVSPDPPAPATLQDWVNNLTPSWSDMFFPPAGAIDNDQPKTDILLESFWQSAPEQHFPSLYNPEGNDFLSSFIPTPPSDSVSNFPPITNIMSSPGSSQTAIPSTIPSPLPSESPDQRSPLHPFTQSYSSNSFGLVGVDTHIIPPLSPLPLRIRRIQPWVCLFSASQLERLLADAIAQAPSDDIPLDFFLHAFNALANAAESPGIPPEQDEEYAIAQNLSMQAYLAVLQGVAAEKGESIACTAAGLLYLVVREVLVRGWCRQATVWLRLAVGIIEVIPTTTDSASTSPTTGLIVRRWFERVAWLWDTALILSFAPDSSRNNFERCSSVGLCATVRGEFTPPLGFDVDQTVLSGFITLCVDLEDMSSFGATSSPLPSFIAAPPVPPSNAALVRALAGMSPDDRFMSICQRVQAWIVTLPPSHGLNELGDDEDETDEQLLIQAVSRIIHLIYFGVAIHLGKEHCRTRKTSTRVAVARIISSAEWLISNDFLWLWSFAAPALQTAQDILLKELIELTAPINKPACTPAPAPPPNTTSTPSSNGIGLKRKRDPLSRSTCTTDVRGFLSSIRDLFFAILEESASGGAEGSGCKATNVNMNPHGVLAKHSVDTLSGVLSVTEDESPAD
ncbi:hypothetical protein BOTBODRAFT_37090 [Botryobasidium botryosum FD-172 SS1]|uniref:Zn(2)-C6 fungal-type domain-containing protein n=1 Tax=Botryobasidium botryosum (strain FD-172 SS1) TaxID=930990 RepID=A0A067M1D4_BOTB1|nr:hypothetical protein BOTBODRAFT_37090 [Botryobasidium botryosum FD-172 SS1]